jgi:hypothetical protein
MKKIILFFVFATIFNLAASAQAVSSKEKRFLKWFFTENLKVKDKEIFYLDQNHVGFAEELKKSFDKDTLRGFKFNTLVNEIVYTKKEKVFVLNEIEKIKKQTLPDHILPFAKSISQDSLNQLFKGMNKGWENMYKKGIRGYYQFHKPIFFRKGTFCIFQYGYSCGFLCGYGSTSVYKKTEKGWEEFIEFSNWVS